MSEDRAGSAYDGLPGLFVEIERGIATVTIDSPPINLFTVELFLAMARLADLLAADPMVRVVVLRSADPDFFIAHFDVVIESSLVGVRKPDPGLLRIAAERAGASLEGSWMIGDDPLNDVQAARSAGIRSVWLRRGRTWPDGLEPPTRTAESFPAAVDLVLDSAP